VGDPCETYREHQELIESDAVDLVIVATPNHTHFEIAKAAVEAGKRVLCEKPMTTSLNEARELVALSEKWPGRLFVGLEFRMNDFFLKINEILQSGRIGRATYFWMKEYRGFFQPGRGGWRLSALSGGTFLEKNVHHFDLLNWFAGGTAARVSALKANALHPDSQAMADEAMAIVEYENGCLANLNVCLHGPWQSASGSHQELGAIGDEGMLEAFLDLRKIVVTPTEGNQEVLELGEHPHQRDYEKLDGYRADYDSWFCYMYPEHEALLDAIHGRPANVPTAGEGYESVRVALTAERAASEGQVLPIPKGTGSTPDT